VNRAVSELNRKARCLVEKPESINEVSMICSALTREIGRGLRRAFFLAVPSESKQKGETKMKNVNSKLMALAGTLAIAATTVYAQVTSMTLKASVPFSFQVGSHVTLPAGDYRISRSGIIWTFMNSGTRDHANVLEITPVQGKMTETANLVFECRGNGSDCALRTIHAGNGRAGASWTSPKGKAEGREVARIVVVPVTVSAE
jgi:hypothetical protein